MHGHLVLDYLSASGKAKSKTVDHIHRVIPKSLPVLCKMASADNSWFSHDAAHFLSVLAE